VPSHQELRGLARLRLKEAECLFDNGLYDGCVYLCGYVLELALKARICKVLGLKEYPPPSAPRSFGALFKTHEFDALKVLARIDEGIARDPALLATWSLATQWTPQIRYQMEAYGRTQAEEMLESLTAPQVGVFAWLRKRW